MVEIDDDKLEAMLKPTAISVQNIDPVLDYHLNRYCIENNADKGLLLGVIVQEMLEERLGLDYEQMLMQFYVANEKGYSDSLKKMFDQPEPPPEIGQP